jgi:hypothetical protein
VTASERIEGYAIRTPVMTSRAALERKEQLRGQQEGVLIRGCNVGMKRLCSIIIGPGMARAPFDARADQH